MRKLLVTIATLLCLIATESARSDDGMVWAIEGETNTVYLVGSIHLLRASDYPLPTSIQAAYDDAERIVMELDMDDLDQMALAATLMREGMAAPGENLEAVLGDDFARASEMAADAGVSLGFMDRFEPWLAAMMIQQMAMMAQGFDPEAGVEMYITREADEDGKPIEGLETAEEQLAFLSGMETDDQIEMLMQTLEELDNFDEVTEGLVSAWRNGDVETMINDLLAPMSENQDVAEAILWQRNREWIDDIEALMTLDDDVMVLVGAAHLVGDDSVNDLLSERGHTLKRIRTSE